MSTQPVHGIPILTRLNTTILYLAGAGLIAMTAVVAWQVFGRFVLNNSPNWTEAGAIMIMSWFIFLGAAVGVRENNHMGFDVLLYVLPPAAKTWLRSISDLVALAFAAGMIWYGSQLFALTWNTRMPALGISGGWNYAPVVGGGVLIGLFAIERLLLRVTGRNIDDAIDEALPSEIAVELENVPDVRRDAETTSRKV